MPIRKPYPNGVLQYDIRADSHISLNRLYPDRFNLTVEVELDSQKELLELSDKIEALITNA
jgi:hypothetical protein